MRTVRQAVIWPLALLILAACGTSEVTSRQSYVEDEKLPRPDRIIVYDFAATPGDVAPESALRGQYDQHATPQTPEEIELGRWVAREVAREFVKQLRSMGIKADRYGMGPPPKENDIVITGEFISIDEGSRVKRVVIGFGAGANKLKTFVEAYQVDANGQLRALGAADFKAGGGRGPGMAAPLIIFGGILGKPVMAAATQGGVSIVREAGPETMGAAARRIAAEIAKVARERYRSRGWI